MQSYLINSPAKQRIPFDLARTAIPMRRTTSTISTTTPITGPEPRGSETIKGVKTKFLQ